MKPILEVNKISKKFLIDHERPAYLSMRDRMASAFKPKPKQEEFWALKDVSFNVMPGESMGIIGRNGAGKSTLLKIFSRITPPTEGCITIRGRIASLLEVGTGFHQELTGRENIFMNGSILGMKRAEIKNKFDEIVDFSGVEKFLDTPLKNYSSGMQLRLAFAVAAHLEPEILIIDEVLAVGDAEFQRKCLGKMEEVGKQGRTILFVSHNMDAIEALCKQSLFLSDGKFVGRGASAEIIRHYMLNANFPEFNPLVLEAGVTLQTFKFPSNVMSREAMPFTLRLTHSGHHKISDLCLLFYNYKRQRIAIYDLREQLAKLEDNEGCIEVTDHIKKFNLVEGTYWVGLYFGTNGLQRDIYDLAQIQVLKNLRNHSVKPYEVQYRGCVELE
jgi:lipopolysaccharide transport system ATP-binding protein